MTGDVELILVGLLAIWISSFPKCHESSEHL